MEKTAERVVITGIGMVTPAGLNAAESWNNIVQGNCCISEIDKSYFDHGNFPVHIAGCVKNFSLDQIVDMNSIRPELKAKLKSNGMDRFSQLALASAIEAGMQSGIISLSNEYNKDCSNQRYSNQMPESAVGAVVFGSGIGGLTVHEQQIADYFKTPLAKFQAAQAANSDNAGDKILSENSENVKKIRLLAALAGSSGTARLHEYKQALDSLDSLLASYKNAIDAINSTINELDAKAPDKFKPTLVPMKMANHAAGKIAYAFDFHGPCYDVTTACATGADAIGNGKMLIDLGYADVVICGGSEASITRGGIASFANAKALTKNPDPLTACRPFDVDRDGFVNAEGAGALILERESFARARGAKIIAELVSYSVTCDAYSDTKPFPEGTYLARAIRRAVDKELENCAETSAETSAETLASIASKLYISYHGTSTPMNDINETNAVKNVFGNDAYKLIGSSVKSEIGHSLGASGAVEFGIALMSLNSGIFPPTRNLLNPDSECDLDYISNAARQDNSRTYVMKISAGFMGHNTVLLAKKYSP